MFHGVVRRRKGVYMKSKSIYKAVEHFCRTRDTGLLVIDSPPGSGKSHQIREYITDNYVGGTGGSSQEEMKRCIWITPHKNNLPTDMVRGPYAKDVLFPLHLYALNCTGSSFFVRRAIPPDWRIPERAPLYLYRMKWIPAHCKDHLRSVIGNDVFILAW